MLPADSEVVMFRRAHVSLSSVGGLRNVVNALPRAHCHRRQRKERVHLSVSASSIADAVDLDVLSFTGEAMGSEHLALRVADPFTAKGLVHRCLVTEKQNARRVRHSSLHRGYLRLLAM